MQQISHISNQTPPLELISARTLFAARPTDPPSSPPPTSPLPALPEAALCEAQKGRPAFRDALSSGQTVRPPRPRRPTTSLPHLKPRTITSPEIYRRQRSTELSAQVKYSLNQQSPVQNYLKVAQLKTIGPCNSIILPITAPQSSSTFSYDVLSALPRLFQRPPRQCLDTFVGSPLSSGSESERLRAWQVYHRSSIKSLSKSKKRKTGVKESVAGSALFIPKTTPGELDRIGIEYSSGYGPSSQTSQGRYVAQSQNTSLGILLSPRCLSQTTLTGSPIRTSPSTSDKRSQAVTASTFDFGNYYGSPEPRSGPDGSGDNLTALPELLSTPKVPPFAYLQHTPQGKLRHPPHFYSQDRDLKRSPYEATVFASLPYAHTIHTAGPQPKTQHGPFKAAKNIKTTGHSFPDLHDRNAHPCPPHSTFRRVNFHSTDSILSVDLESSEVEESRESTEEAIKKMKRKRFLWIIATISLVLMATLGILAGITSKLTHIGRRT